MNVAPCKSALAGVALLFASLVLFGCQSTSSTLELDPEVEVYAGMPAAELLAVFGKPDEVIEPEPAADGAEIWVYRSISHRFTRESAKMPLDSVGQSYSTAALEILEEVAVDSFLLVDEKLIAWKTKLKKREV